MRVKFVFFRREDKHNRLYVALYINDKLVAQRPAERIRENDRILDPEERTLYNIAKVLNLWRKPWWDKIKHKYSTILQAAENLDKVEFDIVSEVRGDE